MNLSHLDRDVVDVALEGRGTRLAFLLDSGFVPWPEATAYIAECEKRINDEAAFGPPHLLLSAPPLCGVGSVLREVERRGAHGGGRRRRAVIIKGLLTFSEVRVTHLISVVLEAAGGRARGSIEGEQQALRAIRDAGTRLLLVRNIDQLPDRQIKLLVRYRHALSTRGDFHLGLASSVPDIRTVLCDADLAARTKVFEFKAWPQALWVVEIVEAALRRYPLRQPSPVTPELMTVLFGVLTAYLGAFSGCSRRPPLTPSTPGPNRSRPRRCGPRSRPFLTLRPATRRKGRAHERARFAQPKGALPRCARALRR
ncbi:MAG: hypothetical protein EON87_04895 [Brevundimonas sp.]|nr:MAG: hypothetical protein EON87_04895 [Brevundimonas sp.]